MPLTFKPRHGSVQIVAGWLAIVVAITGAADPPRKKLSPSERLTSPRLKAATEDAQRLQHLRREVPPIAGLTDYRAILHAHAEDSAHTGGTRAEMLADAKKAGVQIILLSDHHRPPKDFVTDSWRGVRDGVLFLPGSEDRGFLIYPMHSIMGRMKEPTPTFIDAVRTDGGLIFLSHIEERPDHAMTGLNGMEIYNRHADAKKDAAGILAIVLKMTDPHALRELDESLQRYPDALFAAQVEYPADYLAKWDSETVTLQLSGVAANDCHHNQVLVAKMVDAETVKVGTNVDADDKMRAFAASLRPGIREMTRGRKPGDVLARLDFDPYHRSFRNVSTHILAPKLEEAAVRDALRNGRAYVSHDWMCDPTGFRFELIGDKDERRAVMGDEVPFMTGTNLIARFPVSCHIRLLSGGRVIEEVTSDVLERAVTARGVYRVEGWLEVGGEDRGWVYSNPIYIR